MVVFTLFGVRGAMFSIADRRLGLIGPEARRMPEGGFFGRGTSRGGACVVGDEHEVRIRLHLSCVALSSRLRTSGNRVELTL